MAKVKKITLEDLSLEVEVRRAKVREVKGLVTELANRASEILNLVETTKTEELGSSIQALIIDNIDYVISLVERYSNLSTEQIEDLDVLELVIVLKGMVNHNGISEGFLQNFFQAYKGNVAQAQTQKASFSEPIPTEVPIRA